MYKHINAWSKCKGHKKCSRCGVVKPLKNFYKAKANKDGHNIWCRECCREWYHKDYKIRCADKIKERQEKWNRSEAARKGWNKYDATHREQRRAYRKKYQVDKQRELSAYRLNKLHTDPEYYFRHRVRQCVRDSVGRRHLKKSRRTEEIVGMSFDEFKQYLLGTWEKRYGKPWNGEPYHIDHIRPLVLANTLNEIEQMCNYSNLQMLTPEDNLKKGAHVQEY